MSGDLVWSLKNGDLDQVREHIEKNNIEVNSSIDGRPLIHYAADYGHTEVIQYLIQKGANVNSTDKHGISALLAAIWEGHVSSVKLMLEKGADKSGKTPDGKSYLEAADDEEIKKLLSGS
ncbi:Myotrophin [Halotydeus destructor]|nr:Myotrophin [Halotydeus destructor]